MELAKRSSAIAPKSIAVNARKRVCVKVLHVCTTKFVRVDSAVVLAASGARAQHSNIVTLRLYPPGESHQ